jgi:hypothetical protein
MKEAFYQHRNDEKDNRKLNLQNFDVLTSFPSRGDKYFVVTPRRNDRKNSIKNYSDLGDGEIISLSNPQWYMGFQLSPRAHFYVYHQGKPVAIAPYATVACVISFLITGRQSIFPHQRISLDSGKIEGANLPTYTGPERRTGKINSQLPSHASTLTQLRRRARRLFPGRSARKQALHQIRERVQHKK